MSNPNYLALPESGLATRNMVAEYFGVDARTVDKWVLKGILKNIKLGSVVRFSVQDVRNLAQS